MSIFTKAWRWVERTVKRLVRQHGEELLDEFLAEAIEIVKTAEQQGGSGQEKLELAQDMFLDYLKAKGQSLKAGWVNWLIKQAWAIVELELESDNEDG